MAGRLNPYERTTMSRITTIYQNRLLGTLIVLILGPIITIVAFNYFFMTGIALTLETWILVFLVEVLAALLFIGLVLLSVVGFAFLKGLPGLIIIGAAILSLPIILIISFNFLMKTSVPINFTSYLIVGLIMVATAILSGIVKGGKLVVFK